MGVRNTGNNSNTPFLLGGRPIERQDATLLQDAARTTPLVYGTLMARVSASGKYVPFTDETATDGTAVPAGIYIGEDIAAATLVAGDVTACRIVTSGAAAIFDKNQLVIENSKTLATVITVGTTLKRTVEEFLALMGLVAVDSVNLSEFEN